MFKFARLFAVACLACSTHAVGHHSFTAEFDINDPVAFTGTVTRVEWTNPHAWFFIDVETEDGKVENWSMELLGVNALLRQGWTREKIKPGDVLQIQGFRARNGSNTGNASIVVVEKTGEQIWGSPPAVD